MPAPHTTEASLDLAPPTASADQINDDAQGVTPDDAQNATPAAADEEARLIRRMQLMMNLVLQTIVQDHALTVDDAARMIGDARAAALAMFPGKELAYDLIWRPRFQRLMRERFRIM
jgi:hypothetical protein